MIAMYDKSELDNCFINYNIDMGCNIVAFFHLCSRPYPIGSLQLTKNSWEPGAYTAGGGGAGGQLAPRENYIYDF
jgi:hypothetical protein